MANKSKRKLTVLSTDIEYEGTSRTSGQPFTIFNVQALGEDGLPIQERLRTFDAELPQNELIEVEVERRDDARHGTTFTIGIPGKGGGGGGGAKGGGLAASVDALRGRVEALERQVAALANGEKVELQSLATPPGGGQGPTF